MSRSGHLRDGRASAVAASSRPAPVDDDDDRQDDDEDRGNGSDASDQSGDDDDAQQSSRSGGGGNSRRDRRAKKKAEEEKKHEILVDRTVIHEALIRRAIHKDLSTFYDSAVVPLESEIQLESAERLVLSYCNIYAIDNLAGFEKLRHLQLDNNIIERISNLDHLVNLTWLDLSFNHIKEIRGLECLVKLTDLSLTDNELTSIHGLDALVNLNVLSIGNNQITDLGYITPLRKFKRLRALNLKGNPVCSHDDYHNTVFAYLTNLKYLDHTVIEASQFAKARDSKLDQLLILEQKEKADEVAERERKQIEEKQRVLDSANLGGLSTLFADMIKADTEHPKIRVLPGFEPLQKAYREAFQALVDEFVVDMLAKHALKTSEHSLASSVIAKIQAAAVKESVAELDRYQHLQKKAFAAHTDSLDRGALDVGILPTLRAELGAVINELLAIEMLLVEQCESILEEFEKNYMKMIGNEHTSATSKQATTRGTLHDTTASHGLTAMRAERQHARRV